MQKHLRSQKHLKNEKRNELIITEWFFEGKQESIRKKMKKVYNSKTLKQIAREINKTNDKELEKVLAKKMIDLYNFIDDNLKIGFEIILESYNFNHVNSLLTIIPIYPYFGIETRYNNKMFKKMATI